jgi:membrane protease YdiL (CAAX protease family)
VSALASIDTRSRYRHATAVVLVAVGAAALAARPELLQHTDNTVRLLVVLFGALLIVGLAWPVAPDRPATTMSTVTVVAIGIGAFALGRVLGGGESPAPAYTRMLVLNLLAAVAEEAFFRRFVYSALRDGGAAVAVFGSAALFAVVHVTVYGFWVLPLDLAAGLLLSWQRWATGSWRAPAITHVVANLLVVL